MRIMVTLAAVMLAATACSDDGGTNALTTTATTTAPANTTSLAPTTPTESPTPPTSAADEPVCLSGDVPFGDAGVVATLGGGEGDAASISALRWAGHGPCERLVVDLVTEGGAPAGSLGETTVSYRADVGIVRVELPVTRTAVVDSTIEGDLVRRVYAVRLVDGRLAVDIHVATDQPVVVRGFVVGEPTRLVVDLGTAPEGLIPRTTATVSERVVVTSPLPGSARYPLVVSGYVRTFEAAVVARLLVDGEVVSEVAATATDWLDAWGRFELTFEDGPSGDVLLLVGEESARDGRFEGVSIPLETT